MRAPAFYPHRPSEVQVEETHISWVFLAGERVFKLKKALRLPFLDYGSAARRRELCREEVRLNRRLAPQTYLGVRGVVPSGDGFGLSEDTDPAAVDYVVEMLRLPLERTLARLVERGEAPAEAIAATAALLARFHAEAERAPPGSGAPARIAHTLGENFETLLGQARSLLDSGRVAAAERFAGAYLAGRADLFRAREDAGRVRDGHGDLRAEHVVVSDDGVTVFDCLEFDPALRRIDVAADLAFLVMDLELRGAPELASMLVSEYRAAGGDPGEDSLIAFYAAYRAWVRAKVASLRAAQHEHAEDRDRDEVARLAALARRFAWRARGPRLLVVCGGAATGKTRLAAEISQASGFTHLSSDRTRKQLAGVAPSERAPDAAYARDFSLRTYRELGRAVAAETRERGVVADATFRARADREAFAEGAGGELPGAVFVECRAPAAVVLERARRRSAEGGSESDATAEIAARQLAQFEPLDELPGDDHLLLRTDRPLTAVLDDLEALLDARLARGGVPVSPAR